MSRKILVEDQIDKLFNENPELRVAGKNDFEIAVASFGNLKYLNGLDFEDLLDGIMGNGGDEGIDLCYLFCNSIQIKDEEHIITKDSTVKVKFFQVKKETSFSVDGFRKFVEGIEEVFNLELELSQLKKIGANKEIIEITSLIRSVFRKARLVSAGFTVELYYVTIANEIDLPGKFSVFENKLSSNLLNIPFEFNYWDAQKILNLTTKTDETVEIRFDSQPLNISEKSIETTGYAGFVDGTALVEALTDQNGNFKGHLTEGNVRFFLGEDKEINSAIIDTALDKVKAPNFWAMNNGLTIIGDNINVFDSKSYSIVSPQIVNGCQTIHCLFSAFQKNKCLPDNLKVFVKLVKTKNPAIQTDIIYATNSQNPVKISNLKANDSNQINIEKYLYDRGIFYERRDNFYKHQGYSGNKVIGLTKLAQIMHTIVNKESIVALNDTASLFNEDKYKSIFNNNVDLDIYHFSVLLYQKIWFLKNSDLRTNSYVDNKRDLISKGGFVFLHVMSTLMFSNAEYMESTERRKSPLISSINTETPPRKNEFVKRKQSLFSILENDSFVSEYYNSAKEIFFAAADSYSSSNSKGELKLFKSRNFDKNYLIPSIQKFLELNQV